VTTGELFVRSRRPVWPLWSAAVIVLSAGATCLTVVGARVIRASSFESAETAAVISIHESRAHGHEAPGPVASARGAEVGGAPGRLSAARLPELAQGVLGIVAIPRLGVSAVVREGADHDTLAVAAGHIPGTAVFGQGGNIGVAAHRDGLFSSLGLVRPGDLVKVTTLDASYEYRVAGTRIVTPDQVEVLAPTHRETLTLITCYPFHYLGPAPERFVVTAHRIGIPRRSAPAVGLTVAELAAPGRGSP
jgi:sortase A